MSLNESIVEDAALAVPKAALAPALSRRERRGRVARPSGGWTRP